MTTVEGAKATLNDLAIFGGSPLLSDQAHIGRPSIGNRESFMGTVTEILDRARLTNDGPVVKLFEHRVTEALGVRNFVATCNGTLALQIAARAAGLSGDVIMPSFTFIATAHALRWIGLRPVFADIDASTHNIDPADVRRLTGVNTSGVLGVHIWGRPCDIDALEQHCAQTALPLLFDAAQAFLSSYGGKRVGRFGVAEVFSFHATKVVNSLEGGGVATDDDSFADEVRLLRNFGFVGYDEVARLGINGKMNEVSAAMGLASLDFVPEVIAANRSNFDLYDTGLAGCNGVTLFHTENKSDTSCQYVVVEVDQAHASISRDSLMRVLHAENVLARRYFHPGCHRMEPYRSEAIEAPKLPVTEALSSRVLCLPTGPSVSSETVSAICDVIHFAVAHGDEVQARLSTPA